MRVTLINRLAGIQWGGGESYDLELARALRQLGHDVKFVTGRHWFKLKLPMTEFSTFYVRTPYLRWLMYRYYSSPSRVLRKIGGRANSLDGRMFERFALRKIDRNGIVKNTDVFQVSGLPRLGALLQKKTQKPVILVWHGPPSKEHRHWNKQCSATTAFGDSLIAVRKNTDPNALEIPPGVDTNVFLPGVNRQVRQKYDIPENAFVVLFVGRMIPIKNLSFLVMAFAQAVKENASLYLLLVGDGCEYKNIVKLVKSFDLAGRVKFAGWKYGPDLVAHINAANVFLITSIYESYGFVILEAMSCELPVIGPRVGGIPLLIEEGVTGMLIKSGDLKAFKTALVRAASDPELCKAMGRKGRRRVIQTHTWLETAKRWVHLAKQLGADVSS